MSAVCVIQERAPLPWSFTERMGRCPGSPSRMRPDTSSVLTMRLTTVQTGQLQATQEESWTTISTESTRARHSSTRTMTRMTCAVLSTADTTVVGSESWSHLMVPTHHQHPHPQAFLQPHQFTPMQTTTVAGDRPRKAFVSGTQRSLNAL